MVVNVSSAILVRLTTTLCQTSNGSLWDKVEAFKAFRNQGGVLLPTWRSVTNSGLRRLFVDAPKAFGSNKNLLSVPSN